MEWGILLEQVIELILLPLVIYALTLLRGYIVRNIKIKQMESIMLQATRVVETAVAETTQTFVTELKQTGQWDADAMKAAFEKSMDRVLEILAPGTQALIERSFGDINAYLGALIEAEVAKQK